MVIELEGFHTTWCTQSMYASAVRAFEMGFVGLKEKNTLPKKPPLTMSFAEAIKLANFLGIKWQSFVEVF